MTKDELIESKRRERFEAMAVRLAHHLNMSQADKFSDLPPDVKVHLNGLKYYDIIKPLIQQDHYSGMTYRQLVNRYGIAKSTIQTYLKK